MSSMFEKAAAFNRDISGWNVSQVTDMSGMFREAAAFNQPLNDWKRLAGDQHDGMFTATAFNQDLSDGTSRR